MSDPDRDEIRNLLRRNLKQSDEGAEKSGPWEDLPAYQVWRQQRELLERSPLPSPFFRVHDGVLGPTSTIDGESFINFSGYNYLNLAQHPDVTSAAKRAIDQWGTSVSASRVVSGERRVNFELESALNAIHGTESAVVFTSGNITNVTVIGHLMGPGDVVYCDDKIHNSIIQGIALSGARRVVFPHNDWEKLDDLLRQGEGSSGRSLIVLEGAYSMDGDIPDLPRFVEVKKRHGAFLMVDEAHSLGVLGARGRGAREHFGIDAGDVEIWMGTLSKSLASCGGYVAGRKRLIDFLRDTAPGLLFSGGIPPAGAAAALAALQVMDKEPNRVTRVRENAELLQGLAVEAGFDTGNCGGTAVVPMIFGSSPRTLRMADGLFRRGVNVPPILYPAVEERAARLRFFLNSEHSEEQIRFAVKSLVEVRDEISK